MTIQYLRQAIAQIRQHKLYSVICVVGTALPIMMTMVVTLVLYIRFAPIYPEMHRDKMMIVSSVSQKNVEKGLTQVSGANYNLVRCYLQPLPSVEAAATTLLLTDDDLTTATIDEQTQLATPMVMATNGDFWRVFEYEFLLGHPYTNEMMDAREHVAVVSDDFALRLFARTDVVGEKMRIDNDTVSIVGVVRASTPFVEASYADIFVPHNLKGMYQEEEPDKMNGNLKVYLLPKDGDCDALRDEVCDMVGRYNASNAGVYQLELQNEQPRRYFSYYFNDPAKTLRYLLLIVASIILIPAINLSGMIASHMEGRMEEIGVRKAYGATNWQIIRQMLGENMMLTVMGGIVGLVAAYTLLLTNANWLIMSVLECDACYLDIDLYNAEAIRGYLFVNPTILFVTFLLCVVINALAVLLPVRQALKSPHPGPLHKERELNR